MALVLQVSDLHVGGHPDPEAEAAEAALHALVAREAPRLVVASGDLTHRNRAEQHAIAAAFLRSLGPPVLAVPGNHDMPALPPARFTRTFAAFEREWPTREPTVAVEGVVACGICSARPWLYQEGVVTRAQLARVHATLAEAPVGALRLAVLHHHLLGAPWRSAKKAVARRHLVVDGLAAAGVEIVVSGHVHQAAVAERRDFQVGVPPLVVVTCPGLGRPRPTRIGEARGVQLIDADETTIVVRTLVWEAGTYLQTGERRFARAAPAA